MKNYFAYYSPLTTKQHARSMSRSSSPVQRSVYVVVDLQSVSYIVILFLKTYEPSNSLPVPFSPGS